MELLHYQDLVSAVPIREPMTRRQKLLRWAQLCRVVPYDLQLGHNLEYTEDYTLRQTPATYLGKSALAVAVSDPTFNAAGLRPDASIKSVMEFFELTKVQLHEFSCDCGGHISNENQARRIEGMAG